MEKALASFRGSPKPPTLPSGLPIRNVVSKEHVCLVQYEEILKHLHIYAHHTACPRTCSAFYGENVSNIIDRVWKTFSFSSKCQPFKCYLCKGSLKCQKDEASDIQGWAVFEIQNTICI